MTNEEHLLFLAERKRMLIAQGAAYRLGITDARTAVRTSVSAESIAKSAISHVVMGAYTAIKSGAILKGSNLQFLLPLAISGISKLSRNSLVKPLARGALVVAAVVAMTRFIVKKKKASKAKKT